MGAARSRSVAVYADQPSPSQPGEKSVLSDPLDNIVSYENFLDELLVVLKAPLFPMEENVIKEFEVTELSDDEFIVKIIHDGEKLDSYAIGTGDGADFIRAWMKVTHSRSERVLRTEDYDDNGDVKSTSTTRFLSDPFRLEHWIEVGNDRVSDEGAAKALKTFYIDPVVDPMLNRKIKIEPEQDSPSKPGQKSALSDPLDTYIGYNELFDELIIAMKESFQDGCCEILSDDEFVLTTFGSPVGMNPRAPGPFSMTQLVRHSKTEGKLYVVNTVGKELLNTSHTLLHQRPLRIEAWTEQDGVRSAGKDVARSLQDFIDRIIMKVEKARSW